MSGEMVIGKIEQLTHDVNRAILFARDEGVKAGLVARGMLDGDTLTIDLDTGVAEFYAFTWEGRRVVYPLSELKDILDARVAKLVDQAESENEG